MAPNACSNCRSKKLKCILQQHEAACVRCQTRNIACSYEPVRPTQPVIGGQVIPPQPNHQIPVVVQAAARPGGSDADNVDCLDGDRAVYRLLRNGGYAGLDISRGRPQDVLRECQFTQSLVQLYFINYSDVHFMLDEETTLRQLAAGEVPKVLLYSIMALAIRFSHAPFDDNDLSASNRGELMFDHARSLLAQDFDRLSVTNIQVYILLSTYKLAYGGPAQAHTFLSIAANMLQLLRIMEHESDIEPIRIELDRRLVLTLMLMDQLVSSSLRLPLLISPQYYATPTVMNDERFWALKRGSPTHSSHGSGNTIAIQNHVLRISKLLHSACSAYRSSGDEKRAQDSLGSISEELRGYHRESWDPSLLCTRENLARHRTKDSIRMFVFMHLLYNHVGQVVHFCAIASSHHNTLLPPVRGSAAAAASIVNNNTTAPHPSSSAPFPPSKDWHEWRRACHTHALAIIDLIELAIAEDLDMHNFQVGQILVVAAVVHIVCDIVHTTMQALPAPRDEDSPRASTTTTTAATISSRIEQSPRLRVIRECIMRNKCHTRMYDWVLQQFELICQLFSSATAQTLAVVLQKSTELLKELLRIGSFYERRDARTGGPCTIQDCIPHNRAKPPVAGKISIRVAKLHNIPLVSDHDVGSMEAVGAASSIAALAGLSLKIVKYLRDMRHCGESRDELLGEVQLLWHALTLLQRVPESTLTGQDDADTNPMKKLRGPEGILDKVKAELQKLDEKFTKNNSRWRQFVNRVSWPLTEQETQRSVQYIHRLTQLADGCISLATHENTRAILVDTTKIKASVEDENTNKLSTWLSPLSFIQKTEEVTKLLGPEDWLLSSNNAEEQFRRWHDHECRTFWCYGAPGAGKTIMAASTVRELKRRHEGKNAAVLVGFCSFDIDGSMTAHGLVANLLKQVLQIRSNPVEHYVPPKLRDLYLTATTNKDNRPPSLEQLQDILRDELQFFNTAFIILDGLDEAEKDADSGRQAIVRALHSYGPNTKVMISSRQLWDIEEALKGLQSCKACRSAASDVYWRCKGDGQEVVLCHDCYSTPETKEAAAPSTIYFTTTRELKWIRVPYEPQNNRLRRYVESRLDESPGMRKHLASDTRDHTLRDSLINTVVDRSEKIFLLARLHMDSFRSCMSSDDVVETVGDLSADLDGIYSKAIKRVKAGLAKRSLDHVNRLLLWMSWAQRPLSVSELEHALATRKGQDDISDRSIPDVRAIVKLVEGIMYVDNEDLVRFIHPTAGRYFIQTRDRKYPNGDGIIAHCCLDYLNMRVLKGTISGPGKHELFASRQEKYPFLSYAVIHSSKHVTRSRSKDDEQRMLEFLRSDSLGSFLQSLYYLDESWSIEQSASALHVAAYMGLIGVLSGLIETGEPLNSRDHLGVTPLMYACSKSENEVEIVDCLLRAGADPTLTCQIGVTALIRAVVSQSLAVVDRLLKEPEINVNSVPHDPSGRAVPAIMSAVRLDDPEFLERLLKRPDIDVNISVADGSTALHDAVTRNQCWALKKLLSHQEVNVEAMTSGGHHTPLLVAAETGYSEGVEILLEHGAKINHVDAYRGTALMRAADHNHVEVVQLLLRRGINPHTRDMVGRTALHSATINRSCEVLQYLLDHVPDIDVDVACDHGGTALHDACRNHDHIGTAILVAAGARCDIRNSDGENAVDVAMHDGSRCTEFFDILARAIGYQRPSGQPTMPFKDAIELEPFDVLRDRIAKLSVEEVNAIDASHETLLCHACHKGRADVVAMLLKAGADPDLLGGFHRAPALVAIESGSMECLEQLIAHGADVSNKAFHDTPLWELALEMHDKPAMALALIEHGAQIQRDSGKLQYALWHAVAAQNMVAIRRLIESGASSTRKVEGFPFSTEQMAESQGLSDALTLMREFGASITGN